MFPVYQGHWITTSAGTQQFVLGQGNPDKAEKQADFIQIMQNWGFTR